MRVSVGRLLLNISSKVYYDSQRNIGNDESSLYFNEYRRASNNASTLYAQKSLMSSPLRALNSGHITVDSPKFLMPVQIKNHKYSKQKKKFQDSRRKSISKSIGKFNIVKKNVTEGYINI